MAQTAPPGEGRAADGGLYPAREQGQHRDAGLEGRGRLSCCWCGEMTVRVFWPRVQWRSAAWRGVACAGPVRDGGGQRVRSGVVDRRDGRVAHPKRRKSWPRVMGSFCLLGRGVVLLFSSLTAADNRREEADESDRARPLFVHIGQARPAHLDVEGKGRSCAEIGDHTQSDSWVLC